MANIVDWLFSVLGEGALHYVSLATLIVSLIIGIKMINSKKRHLFWAFTPPVFLYLLIFILGLFTGSGLFFLVVGLLGILVLIINSVILGLYVWYLKKRA